MQDQDKKSMSAPVTLEAPPSPSPPVDPGADAYPIKDAKGRFLVGHPGIGGRPKGSKNIATHERQALEAALRSYINDKRNRNKVKKAIDRLLGLAADHRDPEVAIKALKVLLDKVLSQPKQEEDRSSHETPAVHITIENATLAPRRLPDIVVKSTESKTQMSEQNQTTDAVNSKGFGTKQLTQSGEVLKAATLEDGGASAKGKNVPDKRDGTR